MLKDQMITITAIRKLTILRNWIHRKNRSSVKFLISKFSKIGQKLLKFTLQGTRARLWRWLDIFKKLDSTRQMTTVRNWIIQIRNKLKSSNSVSEIARLVSVAEKRQRDEKLTLTLLLTRSSQLIPSHQLAGSLLFKAIRAKKKMR